jgi:hypothetical protein
LLGENFDCVLWRVFLKASGNRNLRHV